MLKLNTKELLKQSQRKNVHRLALAAGITPATGYKYRTGTAYVDLNVLEKLVTASGMTRAEFLSLPISAILEFTDAAPE